MVPSLPPGSAALSRPPPGPPPPLSQGSNSIGHSNSNININSNRQSSSTHAQEQHPAMSNSYPPQMLPNVNVNHQYGSNQHHPGHHHGQHPQQQHHMGASRHSSSSNVNVNGNGNGGMASSAHSQHSGSHTAAFPVSSGPMHPQSGANGPPGSGHERPMSSGPPTGQGQPPGSAPGPSGHQSSTQPGQGSSSHSHAHSSMQNAPAPSPYHRPLHSPSGSRQQPGNHNHAGHTRTGPNQHHPGTMPGQHPPHHNHPMHSMPPGPGPGPNPGPVSSHQQHSQHNHHPHHPMHGHPPQHHHQPHPHSGMPPHGHYPHFPHHPQMVPGQGHPHASQANRMQPPVPPAHAGQSSNNSVGAHSQGGSIQDQNRLGHGNASKMRFPANGSGTSSGGAESKPKNGNWQSSKDMKARRDMIQNIVTLLKRSKKKGDINQVLPQMVKQLEVTLYRSAPSFEAYIDKATLKERLQAIASEISNDSDDTENRPRANGQQNNPPSNYGQPNSVPVSNSSRPGAMGPGHRPRDMRPVPNDGSGAGQHPPHGYTQGPGPTQPQMPPQSRGGTGKDLVNLENVNSQMMRPNPNLSVDNGMPAPALPPVNGSSRSRSRGSSGSLTEGASERGGQESRERLRKQQQRLLLLHHSSKCQSPDGKCKATPYCREMKRLWSHMARCEDYNCRVQHCYSSRTILSHYRKCKDQVCLICKPVRISVWKGKGDKLTPSLGERDGGINYPSSSSSNPNPSVPSGHSIDISAPITAPILGPYPPPPAPPPPLIRPPISQSYPPEDQSSRAPLAPEMPPVENDEWKKRIIHKQQRLLLLRHASKCTAEEGKCKVTPHCHNMKLLWQHISSCSKKDCEVAHCISSRYVLMHYRKCKDLKCPSCQPVREAIRKGHENNVRGIDLNTLVGGAKRPAPDAHGGSERTSPVQKRPKPAEKKMDDTTSTLLKSLTIKQIELHIQSLSQVTQLPPKELKEKCQGVLKMLMTHDDGWVFNAPVDPVALGIPDYFEKVKKPMDLGTIQKRLDTYRDIANFDSDVRRTFDNAILYNEPNTPVHEMGKGLKQLYSVEYTKLIEVLRREEDERRKSDRACVLCGCEKLQFEPPVFFCSGNNCQSKRIHRNRHFYVGSNQYNWCTSCYNELDETPIHVQDMQILKNDLVKKKNDEINEENWVQCDTCDRWMHQICGLFNPRQNKHVDSVKYTCPRCLIDERKLTDKAPDMKNPIAEDLPRTKLSEWLEIHVSEKLREKHKDLAKEKAAAENIPYDQALKTVKSVGKITIRQVTSSDKKLEVRERMLKRYAHKNYPEEFPYRCKCILVFQDLDGVDALLFALYVYEHDDKNPAPNSRTVYISYLDSVYYMRPRYLRTFVYHEILIAYLDHARKRGFATAHIWACPPLKGDDYIFYAKPEDQKTPKDNRLRQWYIDMLIECQKREIVGNLTNIYDLYFAPGNLDATVVPYLEGDYFSGEVEHFIKEVEEGKPKGGKGKSKTKKKTKGADKKDKTKKMRKGTRSGGLEDDFIKGDDPKPCDSFNDPVMKQLGEFIKPMKDSFIVAHLNWEGASEEHRKVPIEIAQEREKRNLVMKPKMEEPKAKTDRKGNPLKIIDDDAEELECEILETRQDFLNLCRKNHYQFDQPRRAKHTSMMVLWHLHNPDAAKIVQMCAGCGKDILNGIRYNCTQCTDYDLCSDCFKNPNTNRGNCTHKLVPKSVDGDSNQNGSGGGGQKTETQRKERRQHIKLHIQLLEHASLCNSPKCTSSNCAKMKQYLMHSKSCKQNHSGGCKICKRILSLLKYHALSCKNKTCPIPNCDRVKDRLRQMRRQQQAMDDRRRQVMNRQYRMGHAQS